MKNAFLFPGQGSQSVGMLNQLAAEFPLVKEVFTEAGEVLGLDLWALCQLGPEQKLNQTEYTQPAVLAADIAVWQVWQASGGKTPTAMAGHSLGEYAALIAAGSITFADGLKLVSRRGRLMQLATPAGSGAMAAIIGLDDAAVERVCKDASQHGVVSAANYNSPGQIVIAGEKQAVELACKLCSQAGARRAMLLAVSVPSHCALMQPAAKEFAKDLQLLEIRSPNCQLIHNVDAGFAGDSESIRQHLLDQLSRPVRWTQSIQVMLDSGIQNFAECGPGKVLSGLNRRIDRNASVSALQLPAVLRETITDWKN